MRCLTALLFLVLAAAVLPAQDFLGAWTVHRIFTSLDQESDNGNRMLHLVTASQRVAQPIEGVLTPQDLTVEFRIQADGRAQHVTLTYEKLLLLSLNWKAHDGPQPPVSPEPPSQRVWSSDPAVFDVYQILYVDADQLVFSDRGTPPARFLDIYQLTRVR